jgi:arginase
MENIPMKGKIKIIGIPLDLGQSNRGVDMGPSTIRYAGLSSRLKRLGYEVHDAGNLSAPIRDSLDETENGNYLVAIQKVCETLYEEARSAIKHGFSPVFLGGDHSIAIGSIGGITHDEPAGVIWIDAHGDANTPESSPSGNIHGMPVSVLLGDGYPSLVNVGRKGPKLEPKDIVMIGIRELDREERKRLGESGITIYTMRDIDERGMAAIANEGLEKLSHRKRIHVSLDLDALEPHEAPGVGTPSNGGLTYREAMLLMEIIADSERFSSLDLVEINPILDTRNQTSRIAVELTASLFGKSIL